MSEQENAPEIVFDLRLMTLDDYAVMDDWAWGRVPFSDAVPVLKKIVANGVDLGAVPLPKLRGILQQVRAAVRDLPGN